jgi:hypothetical protein
VADKIPSILGILGRAVVERGGAEGRSSSMRGEELVVDKFCCGNMNLSMMGVFSSFVFYSDFFSSGNE